MPFSERNRLIINPTQNIYSMCQNTLLFKNRSEIQTFRIVHEANKEWEKIKIFELHIENGQLKIECVAKDEMMDFGGEGRTIGAITMFLRNEWEEIHSEKFATKHSSWLENGCPSDYSEIEDVLKFFNSNT